MDENRLRFGVGVLVISAIGIGIILTFLFGAFPSVLAARLYAVGGLSLSRGHRGKYRRGARWCAYRPRFEYWSAR